MHVGKNYVNVALPSNAGMRGRFRHPRQFPPEATSDSRYSIGVTPLAEAPSHTFETSIRRNSGRQTVALPWMWALIQWQQEVRPRCREMRYPRYPMHQLAALREGSTLVTGDTLSLRSTANPPPASAQSGPPSTECLSRCGNASTSWTTRMSTRTKACAREDSLVRASIAQRWQSAVPGRSPSPHPQQSPTTMTVPSLLVTRLVPPSPSLELWSESPPLLLPSQRARLIQFLSPTINVGNVAAVAVTPFTFARLSDFSEGERLSQSSDEALSPVFDSTAIPRPMVRGPEILSQSSDGALSSGFDPTVIPRPPSAVTRASAPWPPDSLPNAEAGSPLLSRLPSTITGAFACPAAAVTTSRRIRKLLLWAPSNTRAALAPGGRLSPRSLVSVPPLALPSLPLTGLSRTPVLLSTSPPLPALSLSLRSPRRSPPPSLPLVDRSSLLCVTLLLASELVLVF